MPPLSPRSAQAPFEGIASPPLSQVPDAYYSNDDIEILYSVVSRAQEILSNLPEGEQMRGILPGRPRSGLQALATGFWGSRQYTVYITGNAFAILDGPEQLVQTVYDEDEAALLAVAFDEFSGKIATCTKSAVRVYKPLGHAEDALKWGLQSSFLIQTSETDPCEHIDDYLGMKLDVFYMDTVSSKQVVKQQSDSYLNRGASDDPMQETFTEDVAAAINERLIKVGLPQLSGQEQMQLADIIECVGLVDKHRRSLDEDGARFMLFLRQHALRKGRMSEINISWREIVWAFHSGSQDILVDFVIRQYHGSLLWESARESGMFMWLTDTNAMRAQFEIIARNEYTKSEMKNPIDCSLYYLALKKKTVLQGLWRMASWNKEQGATQRLLANNFEDPKWRTTALKNAYALLSKRRFEYAAAFFLLADHLTDAVNVCLHQLKDLQLAIAIARVYEGDSGPVLRKLLEDEVLNVAAREGNRWLASWAFWMLGRKDMAVRSLITPVYTLLETPVVPDLRSKLFLTDDPALVVLYSQLRQKTLQTLRGASKVTPRIEWEFVLHSAKLFDRMGCDLLGLDLVRNWEFPQPTATVGALLGGEANPLKLLRRRSSLVVDDMPFSSLRNELRVLSVSGGFTMSGHENDEV
ncbi:Regulator of V-ATPase in vacuolar membrane protein 1 like [Verticillium longisporum]|nr:Regulator of V-ATPase in vacuolar membrane protein 1 like [Verticillium longisporum]